MRKNDLSDAERTKFDFTLSVHGPLMKEVSLAANAFAGTWGCAHGRWLRGGHASIARPDANYEDLSLVQDPDKLPDVIGGMGFGEFFGQQFIERHVRGGLFEPVTYPRSPIPLFAGVDLTDSSRSYHIFGGTAFDMLVDMRKLEGRPVPRTWADLLDPCYRDMVVCGFNIDDINEVFLLYYYRFFGLDGVAAFADNLAAPVDTLDMMRTSLRTSNCHAILLLPHFFMSAAPQEEWLVPVWPEDGALLVPYFLLAKHTDEERVRDILDFFFGENVGKNSDEGAVRADGHPADLPAALTSKKAFHVYSHGLEPVFEDRRFKWLGWDWLLEHDIVETMHEIDAIVVPRVLAKHPELRHDIGHALWNG